MKKFTIVLFIVFIISLSLFTLPTAIAEPDEVASSNADLQTTNTNITYEQETFAEYFEKVWLDRILTAVSVLCGALSAIFIAAYKVKQVLTATRSTLQEVTDKERSLDEQKDEIVNLIAQLHDLESEYDQLRRQIALIESSYGSLEKNTVDEIAKVKRMLYIFATNDEYLVKKGYAKEVAEVAGYEE